MFAWQTGAKPSASFFHGDGQHRTEQYCAQSVENSAFVSLAIDVFRQGISVRAACNGLIYSFSKESHLPGDADAKFNPAASTKSPTSHQMPVQVRHFQCGILCALVWVICRRNRKCHFTQVKTGKNGRYVGVYSTSGFAKH